MAKKIQRLTIAAGSGASARHLVDPKASAVDPSALSFDQWLDDQLAALYRDVLAEPLPEDLMDLVLQLDRGRSSGND
ncbi:MAG: hypothetical protein AAF495_16060 [Pseudomonadota bacterium]